MASLLRAYKYVFANSTLHSAQVIGSTALLRRPYLASCTTAAVLFGAGDVIAQQAIEGRGKQHDVLNLISISFGIHSI
jgi:hypothetical protein